MTEVTAEEINEALSHWDVPEMAQHIAETKSESQPARSNWLYDLVRRNVKRGRFFQLRDVLHHQQADCLGYAKLMNCLGKRFALDIGVVEVVIDNGGRYVPHYINLIKFPSGERQFMDLWYGAKDIRHRRIGAQIKEGKRWQIKDLDWHELEKVEDVKGLSSQAVEGITHYILGNRHLEKGIQDKNRDELDYAIVYYTEAISLYLGYARAHFNRAIAYENKGEYEKANSDYTQALRDESSQIRVLAREHEDVIGLIELDRANIGAREQEIYLLGKGFITGEPMAWADIAKHCRVPESEVDKMIASIEAKLNS